MGLGTCTAVKLLLLLFGRGAAKAQPGLHHGDRAYRQVNSVYRTLPTVKITDLVVIMQNENGLGGPGFPNGFP
jgi:hypothetical protein